jgi:hypothetical protein
LQGVALAAVLWLDCSILAVAVVLAVTEPLLVLAEAALPLNLHFLLPLELLIQLQ